MHDHFTRSYANPVVSVNLPQSLRVGDNVNGPSIIEVPEWVKGRLGKYYLYFGHHDGKFIRMAYSDRVQGPYTIYSPGTLHVEDGPMAGTGKGHIASPDVHVDHDTKQLFMVYHVGGLNNNAALRQDLYEQGCPWGQVSLLATSVDGIHWATSSRCMGKPYLRVFRYMGRWRGVARVSGTLALFSAPGDGKTLSGNFVQGPLIRIPGQNFHPTSCDGPRIRHLAVHLRGHALDVYVSVIGRATERIEMTTIADLRQGQGWDKPGDWTSTPMQDVLDPVEGYEGAHLSKASSKCGAVNHPTRQLRDPFVFEDTKRGLLHLIYSTAGEQGLGVATKLT